MFAVLLLASSLGAATDPIAEGRQGHRPKGPPWRNGDLAMVPNPVRGSGLISYHLSDDGEGSLSLFSLKGDLVRAWQLRGEPDGEGQLQVQLDGVAPGCYVLVLTETRHGAAVVAATFKVYVRN